MPPDSASSTTDPHIGNYTVPDRSAIAEESPEAPPRERLTPEHIAVGSGVLGTVASGAALAAIWLPGTVGVVAGAVSTVATGIGTWGAIKALRALSRRQQQEGSS